MDSNDTIFAQDKKFWNNYIKGRPQAPDVLFDRIFNYHQAHGGSFGIIHDVGAGNGPYAQRLRSQFTHVIVSDIVARNVELAKERLGTDGFTYRAAKVEEADDIPPGSIDMVFATNVMHFPNQKIAMKTIATQLKPGGTFFCGTFGPARFDDDKVQDLWQRISSQGGRELLKQADNPEETIRIMARTQGNMCPLDTEMFLPGAKRINLNMGRGGIVGMLPPEAPGSTEPNFTGPDDQVIFGEEYGWTFEMNLEDVKEHMLSFPFIAQYPDAFTSLFLELDHLFTGGKVVRGVFPAQLILATRR